jgi:hypothetical protein
MNGKVKNSATVFKMNSRELLQWLMWNYFQLGDARQQTSFHAYSRASWLGWRVDEQTLGKRLSEYLISENLGKVRRPSGTKRTFYMCLFSSNTCRIQSARRPPVTSAFW